MRLKLNEMMKQRRVSQADIAKGLGVTGAAVSAWINGQVRSNGKRISVFPSLDMIEALCRFFECDLNELLEFESDTTPTGKVWQDFEKLSAA